MLEAIYIEQAYQELKALLFDARKELIEGIDHYCSMNQDQDSEQIAIALAELSDRIELSEKRFNQLKQKRAIAFS